MGLTTVINEGWDDYDDVSLFASTNAGSIDLSGTLSRTGKGCLLISALGLGPAYIVPQSAHPFQCFAYFVPSAPGSNSVPICYLSDSVGSQVQIALKYNINLSVSVYTAGSTGTSLLQTSDPSVLVPNSWNYIVIKAFIGNAGSPTGSCKVRVNGTQVINFSGDTQATANAWIDTITYAGRSGGGERVDDWTYKTWSSALDDRTTGPGIYPHLPTADAGPNQWIGSVSGAHYPLVNTVPPDTTKNIRSSNVGDEDLFTGAIPVNQQNPALPGSPSVISVYHRTLARIDSGTGRQIASDIESNIGTSQTLTNSYHFYGQAYDVDPVTGVAWVFSNLATRKFGVKLVA